MPFPLTVAEYFAGIGLVRMGLQSHGWRVLFANDISEKKYEMYKMFFPDAVEHYLVDNIFNINPEKLPPTTLATCSFPCIDVSLAGKHEGVLDGEDSSAFWGFIEILSAQGRFAPPIVLVENIPGWLSSNDGNDFRLTVEALNNLGYACDVFTLDALRFTPQSRERVFLLGTRLPVATAKHEQFLARPKALLPDRLRECIASNNRLRWFYIDIPSPPPRNANGLSRVVEDVDDCDERWWPEAQVARHLAMMNDTHRERVAALVNREHISYRTFYRRRRGGYQRAEVRNDDIAGCLRTAVGGSGKQFLIKAGMGSAKMRVLTPREYARLQGVPDEYTLTVDGVQALTGFGDAVTRFLC